jgi:hypothetical protein
VPDGIDYAFGRPRISTLRNAGVKFVCRYLSHSPSKNLTAAEAKSLSDGGIWIVVVWETLADRAKAGRAAGLDDGTDALAQAKACGMPDDRPIYFAVDWDATKAQQPAIDAYLDGAASVLGKDRVGIYGGYGPVSRALDGGHAKWAWQTLAWSGGKWDPRAQLQQYSNDHTLNGVGCDYDRATTTDFGQWRVGAGPHVQEDDMAQVSTLGADGKQTIAAGKEADVKFTTEYSDKHNLHGDNGVSVVIATGTYWGFFDALIELHGLAPGEKINIAWTRVKDDGTYIDDPWKLAYTADENGVIRDQINTQFGVNASNRARLRVYNTSNKTLTVQGCLAKAALVTY